ncbi:hypothetical protein PRIPAC_96089 [Pristionchus pacificus]|uniref:Ald_Xan_dh_C domain-containing protein n=1 Tax=Pristionchus pacificus TaxID=54126 RepID=A0A2A6D2T4_PRIPA|nr:hypothetical protein PRIPAC_96089 [Pristionchus pacificus]|eukprot:PDM84603.1 hypothetical protein PRIPAC_33626 [Pristionchus pacificus]
MAAYALLRNNPTPTADEIRSALVGNLCRCTGYRPILEALEKFAKPADGCCMGGRGGCSCKEGDDESAGPEQTVELACGLVDYEQMQKFDETAEIIFPPKLSVASEQRALSINGKRITLYCPTTLETQRIAAFKHGKRFGADDAVLNAAACYDAVTGRCRIAVGAFHKPILLHNSAQLAEHIIILGSNAYDIDDISTSLVEDFKVFSGEKDVEYKANIAKAALNDMFSVLAGDERGGGLSVARDALEPLQLYKAHARILSIDPSEALAVEGVLAYVDARVFSGEKDVEYKANIAKAALNDMFSVLAGDERGGGLSVARDALEPLQLYKAHARILSIDPSEALAVEGVLAYVDARDLPTGGLLRPCQQPFIRMQDNAPVFADGIVESVGQPIGCIVADDVAIARRAAKLVRVEYERLSAILTIEVYTMETFKKIRLIVEAIAARSFIGDMPTICGKSEEEIEAALKARSQFLLDLRSNLYIHSRAKVMGHFFDVL